MTEPITPAESPDAPPAPEFQQPPAFEAPAFDAPAAEAPAADAPAEATAETPAEILSVPEPAAAPEAPAPFAAATPEPPAAPSFDLGTTATSYSQPPIAASAYPPPPQSGYTPPQPQQPYPPQDAYQPPQAGYQPPQGAYPPPQAGYGYQQQVPPQPVGVYAAVPPGYEQKSKLAAGLLGIFLGGLGIGRFYLGYTGLGVAQLLVSIFTFGIGAIWGFIDGILILTGSPNTDGNGVPLKD
ncbi:MAG: TM2 domain-containing protein [Propionibacteriaceae bacterium]|jgi:TM2 domain-containing membrane protein YozV|nr:TM2 domain-containing protein [Propionibacteriaceae bacterium]